MCERCGGGLERLELLGGMIHCRCRCCGHRQFVRAQPVRGVRWRNGEAEHVIETSGEIEVSS